MAQQRQRIPQVVDGQLLSLEQDGAEPFPVPVGSPAWFSWLADERHGSFSFRTAAGAVTLRRERKRQGWYWYAYRTVDGKLRKVYAGKGEDLAPARLDEIAAALARPDDRGAAADTPAPAQDTAPRPLGGGLLRTKLYAPPPRADLVPRPRLLARLAEGLRGKLTLLAAPAGAGKTTLLSAWRAAPPGSETPLAWVSLDAGDNDPLRFLGYLAAALDELDAGLAADALALLRSPRPPPPEAVLTALLNALAALPWDGVLVLDDYHAIEAPDVNRVLAALLEHLPPRLHLVIATRADPPLPLGRLRARGELVELRAADLRFTPDEAAAFLREAMGLDLPAEQVAALADRVEGWAAGLQLAALSLRGREDPGVFIAALAGSHRYLADYLVEEVLGRQPEPIQAFLLDTAVLDRLCGPLCDAVTGRDDGEATLERLEAANLFLVPLDDERRWYRYHHLFADFLRARLTRAQPERPAELHRRAAAWHERAGLTEDAFRHLLAARAFAEAARLAEEQAESLLVHSGHPVLLRWVAALPVETARARPRLGVFHAFALAWAGQLEAAEEWLAAAERALGADPAEAAGAPSSAAATLAEATALRASITARRGDHRRALELARQAEARLPPDRIYSRAIVGQSLGNAYLAGDQVRAAREAYAEAAALCQAAGFPRGGQGLHCAEAEARLLLGDLWGAAAGYRQVLRTVSGPGGAPFLAAQASFGLGDMLREWDELADAERLLRDGLRLLRPFATPAARGNLADLLARGAVRLARVQSALGDPDGAEGTLRDAAELTGQVATGWAADAIAAGQARLRLARGDVEASARWARAAGLGVDDPPAPLREPEYRMLARVLLAQGRHDSALALLERLLPAAERAERLGSVVELLVLQALAHRARGDTIRALEALARALALGEPAGYLRVFLDEGEPLAALLGALLAGPLPEPLYPYAERILAALAPAGAGDAPPAAPAGRRQGLAATLPEPLTAREVEVLGLMAAGLSNREIAARLYIGVGTVKTHVNRLFAKLAAASRTQAVARARELGLLAE